MNTRAAAVQILNHLPFPFRQYELAIQRFLIQQACDQNDRDFIELLVIGVIIYHKQLDFIIKQVVRRPFQKLETMALNLLRVGVLQKINLRLPDHAVVNETVEAARQLGRADLAGLVNATLRHLPPLEVWRKELAQLSHVEQLAIEFSHPEWLIERWLVNFGEPATRQLLAFNNEYQAICWRHNPRHSSWSALYQELVAQGYKVQTIAQQPTVFFTVDRPGHLLQSSLFREGACSVQDYSQGLAVQLLNPQPAELILDLCAAPGGKTTYTAQLTDDRAKVIAYDKDAVRLVQLTEETHRLGLSSIETAVADASRVQLPRADKIIVDAPCTGTGVIARRANLRWNRTPADLEKMPLRQLAILHNVSRYLRRGGVLVYCTCSIEPEENWLVVEEFINTHPEFVVEPADKYISAEFCDDYGAVQVLPFRQNLTGAFAVRLVKSDDII